jgi:hypothetical protein
MFYTAAWCIDNEENFRKKIPLELLGESLKRHKSSIEFRVVILEGIELLSQQYLSLLQEYGFTIIDYSRQFREIIAAYETIDAGYSQYERNCLLRWIAFKQIHITSTGSYRQFWHLDSDVVMHTSLDHLASDTAGKTFMLQGCPVLVSVSDPAWFDMYEQNLKSLNKDITGYSAQAWKEKSQCRENDAHLVNLSFYRNPIGSDQDLLEYLVSSKKIIQHDRTIVYNSDFYFVQNALAIKYWHEEQGVGNDLFRFKENDQIAIAGKSVPFVHYQNTFTGFAQLYLLLNYFRFPKWMIKKILAYQIEDDKFYTTFLFKAIAKIDRKLNPRADRKFVIRKLMQRNPKINIAELLNFLVQF